MWEFAALLLLLLAAWLWFETLARRETAIDAARRACAAEGVQLLDETVALTAMRLTRAENGAMTFQRVYRFEFSDTGNNRLTGNVTLLGGAVQALYLEPHCGDRIPRPLVH